jgi:acetyl-CoA C-acetyltransferase
VKDRLNALKNPYAHLQLADITLEAVKESPMVWAPVHRLESCPTSDGAAAMVLASEDVADRASKPAAWVHGTAIRSELGQFPGRDPVNPQGGQDTAADVYKQAGITDPRRDVDVVECYVPFSWYEPMWMENLGFAGLGEGWKMTETGATEMTGDLPVNPSGGVLSSNPIGASGMLRFLEAALQVRGMAGEHQIDGARTAVGHAYGGAAQFFAMWVVRSEKP